VLAPWCRILLDGLELNERLGRRRRARADDAQARCPASSGRGSAVAAPQGAVLRGFVVVAMGPMYDVAATTSSYHFLFSRSALFAM
jgi:hypothetical protein